MTIDSFDSGPLTNQATHNAIYTKAPRVDPEPFAFPDEASEENTSAAIDAARQFTLFRSKVPKDLYTSLRELFPEAWEDTKDGQFLNKYLALVFSGHVRRDKETDGILAPCEAVALLAGVRYTKKFSAQRWLEKLNVFADRGLKFETTPYSKSLGRCRTLVYTLSPSLEKLLAEAEWMSEGESTMVWFDTGRGVARRELVKEKNLINEIRRNLVAELPQDSMQRPLMEHLNIHTLNMRGTAYHNALIGGIAQGKHWLKVAAENKTLPAKQLHDCYTALETLSQPQPSHIYHTCSRTSRVQAGKNAPELMRKEMRKIVLQGTDTFDMKTCGPAIASKVWGADVMHGFLQACQKANTDPYERLVASAGLPGKDAESRYRSSYKLAMNQAAFCMKETNLHRELRDRLRGKGLTYDQAETAAKRFLKLEQVRDLLDARDERMRKIEADAGVRLCDWEWAGIVRQGAFLPLYDANDTKLTTAEKERQKRSLLAQEIQAAEFALMYAPVEVIAGNPSAMIVSWIHDGFSVHHGDRQKRDGITRKLIESAQARCTKLGYPTQLELE